MSSQDAEINVHPVGYLDLNEVMEIGELPLPFEESLNGMACGSWVVNVDTVLSMEYDDPPTTHEQRIIEVCKRAKAMGIEDLIVDSEY